MNQQFNLFENPLKIPRTRKNELVMSKDFLRQWKSRIFKYQQSKRNSQSPQQNSLFQPTSAYGSPEDIEPFELKLHTALFYRMPETAQPVEGIDTGCIYFIIDPEGRVQARYS